MTAEQAARADSAETAAHPATQTADLDAAYEQYRKAFEGHEFPLAYCDLALLESNLRLTRERSGDLPVRVASKSVRCRAVLRRVLESDGVEGVMCYAGDEAVYLAEHGFDDLLVAYPVWHETEIERVCDAVADGTRIVLMVDSTPHVERVAGVAREAGVEVALCIDLDLSTEHLGIYFGVRRSPITTPAEALALADDIAATEGVRLAGLMGYEGQIAGLPDRDPSRNAAENAVIRGLKARSKPKVRERRQSVASALSAEHDLAFVNGGGTGSVEFTGADPWVTEVTVGSGFYAPQLFDFYDDFQYGPAAGYAVEVTRRPTPDIYTCRGGGYVASGPTGEDKAPAPYLPDDAELLDNEGAGEVQTPVRYEGAVDLELGDPVLMRHAKAGELCRTFDELHLVRGDRVVESVPTYRGDGRCFL